MGNRLFSGGVAPLRLRLLLGIVLRTTRQLEGQPIAQYTGDKLGAVPVLSDTQ